MENLQSFLASIINKLDMLVSILNEPFYTKVIPPLLGAIGGVVIAFVLAWWKDHYRKPKLIYNDLQDANPHHFNLRETTDNEKYFFIKCRLHNTNPHPVTYLVYVQSNDEPEQRARHERIGEDGLDYKQWRNEPLIVERCDIYELCVAAPWEISRKKIPRKISVILRDYRNKKVAELSYVPPNGL